MYINGHWERVIDLNDISRIIREYYNEELADELDELIRDVDDSNERIKELEDLLDEIRYLVE